ncbi:MAG: hypothetical protein JSS70_20600 [Bacteroidetes bacterium]|nr:hypothetical protein [Bacteroidota bacterium]
MMIVKKISGKPYILSAVLMVVLIITGCGGCSNSGTEIRSLEETVNSLKSNISTLQNDLNEVQTKNKVLESELQTVKSEINSLKISAR